MITAWDVYLVGQVDCVSIFLGVIGTVLIGLGAAFVMLLPMAEIDFKKELFKKYKIASVVLVSVAFLFLTLSVMIPSSKTLAAMYVIPAITQNDEITGIAGDGLKIIKTLTSEYLKDISKGEGK